MLKNLIKFLGHYRVYKNHGVDYYNGDESAANMRYFIYLIGRALIVDEVKNRLLNESLEKIIRFGNLEHYLELTTSKAAQYVYQNNNNLRGDSI